MVVTVEDLEAMGYSYYEQVPEVKHYPTPSEYVKNYYETAGIEPDPIICGLLITEEYEEWFREWFTYEESRPEAELKELADLKFVIEGYALSRGWDLETAFHRVAENNLQRMVWDDGEIHLREDGKIMRNPKTEAINLSDLV